MKSIGRLCSSLKISMETISTFSSGVSSHLSNRQDGFGTHANDPIYSSTIDSIATLSPSIKQFHLTIDDPSKSFNFRPGMFLDIYLPSTITSIITGYSICNSPFDYQTKHLIELAIKKSDYPPTEYMFDRCRIGDTIGIKPGGKFFYDNFTTNQDSLLLICAGIGANPIVCILRHLLDLFKIHDRSIVPHRIQFFYTAATQQDLIFRSNLEFACTDMVEKKILRTNYFITREFSETNFHQSNIDYRRMNASDLSNAIQWLEKPVTAYVCGPSAFIDWVEITLKQLNVRKILYEKWW